MISPLPAEAYMAGDKLTVQIAADYNIAKSDVSQWVNQYKEECLYNTNTKHESNEAKEIRRLNQLLNEKDKRIIRRSLPARIFVRILTWPCYQKRFSRQIGRAHV